MYAARSYASFVAAIAAWISLANVRSQNASRAPVRSSPAFALAIISVHQSISVWKRRMLAFAVFSSKLASSMPSPASASDTREASAPNFSTDWRRESVLPVLLDILAPLSIRWPLARIARGQCFSGKMAAWL